MRALISVFDKFGIVEFASKLTKLGVEIISTGGTYNILKQNGLNVTSAEEITDFKECLDGRVKTLHPNIHAGILAKRDDINHINQIKDLNIGLIDFVVVNLYPFKETMLKEGATHEQIVENIDIGGPTMLRAGAKNYESVSTIVDPKDYDLIISQLEQNGKVSKDINLYLCAKVFALTAHYDTLIANYMKQKSTLQTFGDTLTMTFEKVSDLRYGENPHQNASFYKEVSNQDGALTNFKQIHGKEMSFNNINDTTGALELLKEFDEPTIVACKHSTPCGVGSSSNIFDAYMKAYNADPISIFGGIVVSNMEIDEKTAEQMSKTFLEVVLAPSFSKDAINILSKKKNIRLLTLENILQKQVNTFDFKKVCGGILMQDTNDKLIDDDKLEIVTKRVPTKEEMEDLIFTFKVVKHTKSNGIALGKNKQSIGIGSGEVNRIWATENSLKHAVELIDCDATKGCVLASDAFFPFDDCIKEAIKYGVSAIIQPGGSIRDTDSIKVCDDNNIAMVFTKIRHFRH